MPTTILAAAAAYPHIIRSLDNAATWSLVAQDLTITAIEFLSPGVVLAGGSGYLKRSTDYGATWTAPAKPVGYTSANSIRAIAYAGGNTVFAVANTVLLKSTDLGLTWSSMGTFGTIGISVVRALPNNVVLVGSDDGYVFYSTNNGSTFGTAGRPTGGNTAVVDFCYAGTNNSACAAIGPYCLLSSNNGANWTVKYYGSVASALAYQGNGVIYIAQQAGTSASGYVIRSLDYGNTWTASSVIAPNKDVNVVESISSSTAIAIAWNNNGIVYKTTDNGQSWSSLSRPSVTYETMFNVLQAAITPDNFTVSLQYQNAIGTFTNTTNVLGTSSFGSGITAGTKTLYWHDPKSDRGEIDGLNNQGLNNQTVKVIAEPDLTNLTTHTLVIDSATQLTTAESTASKGDVKITYTIS